MHFLPDVWVECDACRGRRYNPETLAVRYHGQSIADVLDMSCGRAVELFENIPKIRRMLQTLCDVGLDYLTLGQAAPTLSGGEAQRVKLAAELAAARHRPDAVPARRADDRPALRRHGQAARRAQSAGRPGQHGRRDRAQSGRDQDGRLGDRHGPRGRRRWRISSSPPARRSRLSSTVGARRRRRKEGQAFQPDSAATVAIRSPAMRSHTGEALAPVLAAGPHVERKSARLRRGEAERPRRCRYRGGRPRPQNAVGSRRPPLAHAGSRRPQRAAVPLGRRDSGPRRRSDPRAGRVQPDRIGTAATSSKSRARRNPTAGSSTRSPARNGC